VSSLASKRPGWKRRGQEGKQETSHSLLLVFAFHVCVACNGWQAGCGTMQPMSALEHVKQTSRMYDQEEGTSVELMHIHVFKLTCHRL
jgi:hypothetical protein